MLDLIILTQLCFLCSALDQPREPQQIVIYNTPGAAPVQQRMSL